MNLFELAAVLTLNRSAYDRGIHEAGEEADSFGSKLKSGLGAAAKAAGTAMTAAAGAAVTAVSAMSKKSLDAYANYEQLVGGVETLFGAGGKSLEEYAEEQGRAVEDIEDEYSQLIKVQNQALKNADKAYQTAGLSANEYMETITSFAASLKQSLGGENFEELANVADKAITDMADNANKMGTSMESIQNAYQGFAKQNYTMLDNLKLGYGGTSSEMARLINESGVLGDALINLNDTQNLSKNIEEAGGFATIIEAIHVVQEEMGITGTTSKEAGATISGSVASMQAAWENFTVALAEGDGGNVGGLLTDLANSAVTAAQNIIPRIEEILGGIGEAITELSPIISDKIIPMLTDEELITSILDAGVGLLDALIEGITTNIEPLSQTAFSIIMTLFNAVMDNLPKLVSAGLTIITTLANGIGDNIETIVDTIVNVSLEIIKILTDPETLTGLLDAGLKIIMGLAMGLIDAIPTLLEALPTIITSVITALVEFQPQIITAGIQLFTALVGALPEIIGLIVAIVPKIITSLIEEFSKPETQEKLIDAGIELFSAIAIALPEILEAVVMIVPEIVKGLFNAFTSNESMSEIRNAGKNMMDGLWKGIQSMTDTVKQNVQNFFGGLVDGIKDTLGIHSPSTVFAGMGKNMALGVGVGFDDEMSKVAKEMENAIPTEFDAASNINVGQVEYSNSAVGRQAAAAAASYASSANGSQSGAVPQPLIVIFQLPTGVEVGRQYIEDINAARRADGNGGRSR